eukprot:TRINITY_DN26120_c0_g1_i1.p1 TRINITY_DN26120_c0_g1~~TRINITY_DN26120_c0_g1_i1.p1  ORF type:complete len:321 (-),score=88.71 TRINITY_DN26120_c0_g1_i1:54-1016(-)
MESPHLKMVVVGEVNAIKSELLQVYVKSLSAPYVPNKFDNFTVNAVVQGKMHLLSLCDTTTPEGMKEVTYSKANVIIYTFSKSDFTTGELLKLKWSSDIKKYCPKIPTILVGVITSKEDSKRTADLARDLNVTNFYDTELSDVGQIKKIFSDAAHAAVDQNLIIAVEGLLDFTVISGKCLGKHVYCKFGLTDKYGEFIKGKVHKTKNKSGSMAPTWKTKDKNSKEFIVQAPIECKKFKIEVWENDVLANKELLAYSFLFLREFQDNPEYTAEIMLKTGKNKTKKLDENDQPRLKVSWKFTLLKHNNLPLHTQLKLPTQHH